MWEQFFYQYAVPNGTNIEIRTVEPERKTTMGLIPLSNAKRNNRAETLSRRDLLLVERIIVPCNLRAVGTPHTMHNAINFVSNGTRTKIGSNFSTNILYLTAHI
jgi:hypothetical protein